MNRLGGFGDRDIELEGWLRIAMDGNNWFDKDQVLYERFNGSGLRIGRWVKVAVGGSNRFGKVRVLVQYFYRGPKAEYPRRSKGTTTVHSYGSDFLIQEEQLNHEVQRTRIAPRPAMLRSTTPSTTIQAPAPKKLTRDKLRERSAEELCWNYDEPWSREHHYKKGRLLVIEPAKAEDNETSEEALEPKEEAMEEESPSANYAVHALAGYSNQHMMKVGGLLK
ncbi:hypothetical protein BHE74_00040577 [Ensete ventricosum]|nr:hypothetical protein BHE74_00040577 [Ensete ventricosum]